MKFTAVAQLITFFATITGSNSAENPREHRSLLWLIQNDMKNFRVGQQYTTWTSDGHLTKVGSIIEISPADSYDFVPARGYGQAQAVTDELRDVEEEFGRAYAEERAGWFTSIDGATSWAKSRLGNGTMVRKDLVPVPNESLIARELTVDAVEELSTLSKDKVLCHETELGSYFCHNVGDDKEITISKVTVSTTNGKPSTIFVACHYFGNSGCHVMNVNDFILSRTSEEKMNLSPYRQKSRKHRRGRTEPLKFCELPRLALPTPLRQREWPVLVRLDMEEKEDSPDLELE